MGIKKLLRPKSEKEIIQAFIEETQESQRYGTAIDEENVRTLLKALRSSNKNRTAAYTLFSTLIYFGLVFFITALIFVTDPTIGFIPMLVKVLYKTSMISFPIIMIMMGVLGLTRNWR